MPATRGTDHPEHRAGPEREARAIEEHRPVGEAYGQIGRRIRDLARVDVLLQVAVDEAIGVAPDADHVELREHHVIDPAAVHERAVVAPQVDRLVASVAEAADLSVSPGDLQVVDHYIAVRIPADAQNLDGQRETRCGR